MDLEKGLPAIIAAVIIIAGIVLVWNNEGTHELERNVISAKCEELQPENDGLLVATKGKAGIGDYGVKDVLFNISTDSYILVRLVEVNQWQKNGKKDEYSQVWSAELIDSTDYSDSNYSNPTSKLYLDKTTVPDKVMIGKFRVSGEQLSLIEAEMMLSIPKDATIPDKFHVSGSYITNSVDFEHPEPGDVRISFYSAKDEYISVLGVQNGDTFSSYRSKDEGTVFRIESGNVSGKKLIKHFRTETESSVRKWVVRLLGSALLIAGFILLLSSISAIKIPLPWGSYFTINVGEEFVPVLPVLIGGLLTTLTIAISWFTANLVLSIILLLVDAGLVYLIVVTIRDGIHNICQSGSIEFIGHALKRVIGFIRDRR